jgi:hypothetical protein
LVRAIEGLNASGYTPASWAAVASVLARANALLTPGANPSAAALTALTAELSAAVSRLVVAASATPPAANAGAQSAVAGVAAAVGAQTAYTPASWAAFARALTAAQAVINNPKSSAASVTAALNALMSAAVKLEKKPVAAVKITTKSITVTGKAFKKKSKPKVTVTIALSQGVAKGKVAVYVGKKKVKTVAVNQAKTVVKLPERYSKAVRVKAKYAPASAIYGTARLPRPRRSKSRSGRPSRTGPPAFPSEGDAPSQGYARGGLVRLDFQGPAVAAGPGLQIGQA